MISSYLKNSKTHLLSQLTQFLSYMGIPYILLFLYFSLYKSASIMNALYFVLFLTMYLNRLEKSTHAKFLLISGLSLILLTYSFLLGSKSGAPLIFFSIIALPLILFETTEFKKIMVGCLIPVVCRFLYDITNYISPTLFLSFRETLTPSSQFIIYEFAVFTSFLFTFIFIFYFYQYQKMYFSIQKDIQKIQNKEFKITKEIQERLLPKTTPKIKGLRIDAISESAHLVGGDFYEFIKINEYCVDIVMADIVGKGLPACLHMVAFKSILAGIYDTKLAPNQLMRKLNSAIYKDPVFKTHLPVIICRLNMNSNTLIYCNAGHEYSLLSRMNNIEALKSTGPVLGVDENDKFEEIIYPFQKEDSFFMFTDGLTEARNNFGEHFYKILHQTDLHKTNAKTLKRQVMEFSNNVLRDDLTIVSISHT